MALRCKCQGRILGEDSDMVMSLEAAATCACGPGRCLVADGDALSLTRLMLHLLAGQRKETSSHQQTEYLAQLLSLAGREPFPKLRQREQRCGRRWRRGGTQYLELSNMEYLLVVRLGVPGTTAPLGATPMRGF